MAFVGTNALGDWFLWTWTVDDDDHGPSATLIVFPRAREQLDARGPATSAEQGGKLGREVGALRWDIRGGGRRGVQARAGSGLSDGELDVTVDVGHVAA